MCTLSKIKSALLAKECSTISCHATKVLEFASILATSVKVVNQFISYKISILIWYIICMCLLAKNNQPKLCLLFTHLYQLYLVLINYHAMSRWLYILVIMLYVYIIIQEMCRVSILEWSIASLNLHKECRFFILQKIFHLSRKLGLFFPYESRLVGWWKKPCPHPITGVHMPLLLCFLPLHRLWPFHNVSIVSSCMRFCPAFEPHPHPMAFLGLKTIWFVTLLRDRPFELWKTRNIRMNEQEISINRIWATPQPFH